MSKYKFCEDDSILFKVMDSLCEETGIDFNSLSDEVQCLIVICCFSSLLSKSLSMLKEDLKRE